MRIHAIFGMALIGIIAFLTLLVPRTFQIGAQPATTTLRLHTALDTGLTSCALEAGSGYDLAALGVGLPFVVQSITIYAQTFGRESSGSVTLNVYSDDDFNPTNGATLVSSPGTVGVSGGSPSAYMLNVADARVLQPYLYVIANFDTPVVINASSVGSGGISFSSGCGEAGLAALTHTVGSDTARLGIEVNGYSEIVEPIVTDTPTPTATTEATIEVTAEVTIEITAESTAVVTESSTATTTITPTEASTSTPEATSEATLEVTAEVEITSTTEASSTAIPTSEPTSIHTAEATEAVEAQPPQSDGVLTPEPETTEANEPQPPQGDGILSPELDATEAVDG